MRKITLLLLLLAFISSCSDKEIPLNTLVERNGVMYEVNNKKPFSGKVFEKFKNEQLKLIGYYNEGLKTGIWENYQENGQILGKKSFQKGLLNGLYEKYNKEGKKIKIAEYKNDNLDGIYKTFEEEKLTSKGSYKEGKKEGAWNYYHHNESTENENYINGNLNGNYTITNKNGIIIKKGIYENNEKEGNWFEYYNNGSIKHEITYKNNDLISIKTYDDEKNMIFEANYPGLSRWYKNNNIIAQAEYISENNLIQRSVKIWFNNKAVFPYEILSEPADWAENGHDYKKGTSATYYSIAFRKNNMFSKRIIEDGRWISLVNNSNGNWSINKYELPKLEIVVKTKSGNIHTYSISELSSRQMIVDDINYIKVRTF